MDRVSQALEKYFGYTTFRPLQEEIVRDILDKKDTFVLMPTGGGKSLCYQLPSVVSEGVTIVVSPLISLMKDQVDALNENGIPAAFLNSSLTTKEQSHVLTQLEKNELHLLYVAPERLVLPSFLELLHRLPLNFFAIDEAHCISQWGHDFRPEYRKLRLLRDEFPKIPIVALTATATERVKEDILKQLALKNPTTYQASFNRPNLTYFVHPKLNTFQKIYDFIRQHKGESGIIYCQSRKEVDQVTKKLQLKGLRAAAYHAGLEDQERRQNQEAFVKDNVEIIVATIAFGMGIDKPNVRYVIHYGLPKSIENYYQETGRAGRDGLPSACIFFFSIGDMFFYERFITEMASKEEQRIAKRHLHDVIQYAQSTLCRRKQLLSYFQEAYDEKNCQSCDNCLTPRETFDGTIIAQKILSCVYRVEQRFGANHVVDVLTGAETEKILQWRHNALSTFNIVDDFSTGDLKMFVHELIHLGYLQRSDDQYALIKLTPKSKALLTGKEKVQLTKAKEIVIPAAVSFQDSQSDKTLFEILRKLRKTLADAMHVPPYIIFSDASLREMTITYPQNEEQFARIKGVGSEKLQKYGEIFIKEITEYCENENIIATQWVPIKR